MTAVQWHVLGAGAMGCLFASQLQQAGSPATLILRDGNDATAARITVERDSKSRNLDLPVSSAAHTQRISHLLVTTKAQDVCTAVLSVGHRLDAASQVLLLANGLGYAAQLRTRLPTPQYFQGTTTAGAYRSGGEGPGDGDREQRRVVYAGSGLTRIGQPGRAAPPAWFEHWSLAVQPSEWDPRIEQALWLKLAINCVINPLTAMHRCRNGALAEPRFAPQLAALCREIMQVSAAAGFADITANLPEKVAGVIRATANNRSSMLQDVLADRATEIEYITGHLLRVAHEHGVAAPLNESLLRRIVERAD